MKKEEEKKEKKKEELKGKKKFEKHKETYLAEERKKQELADQNKRKKFENISQKEYEEAMSTMDLLTEFKDEFDNAKFDFVKYYRNRDLALTNVKRKRPKLKTIKGIKDLKVDRKNPGPKQSVYNKMITLVKQNKKLDQSIVMKSLGDIELTPEQYEFYNALINLRPGPTDRLTLPRKLCQDDIEFFCLSSKRVSNISNDWLKVLYDFASDISKSSISSGIKLFNLKSVKVSSNTIFKMQSEFKCFYCQDFLPDVYLNEFVYTEELKKELKNVFEYGADLMEISGSKYNVYSTVNGVLIYKEGIDEKDVEKYADKAKVFYVSKGNLLKGVKKLINKDFYYYYSQIIVPTKFCPSNLIFDSEEKGVKGIELDYLYRFSLDLNLYLNKCIEENKVIFYENMITWYNYTNFLEFFQLLEYFTYKENNNKSLLEGMDKIKYAVNHFYEPNKEVIALWKTHYDNFKKILYSFLDSFIIRVNLDKLDKIAVECAKYIDDDIYLKNLTSYSTVASFLMSFYEATQMMLNFLKPKVVGVIDAILEVCDKMKYAKGKENLETSIRSAGIVIYDMFFTGECPVLYDVRSEVNFLGGIIASNNPFGLDEVMNFIKYIHKKQEERDAKRQEKKKKESQREILIKELAFKKIANFLNSQEENFIYPKEILKMVKDDINTQRNWMSSYYYPVALEVEKALDKRIDESVIKSSSIAAENVKEIYRILDTLIDDSAENTKKKKISSVKKRLEDAETESKAKETMLNIMETDMDLEEPTYNKIDVQDALIKKNLIVLDEKEKEKFEKEKEKQKKDEEDKEKKKIKRGKKDKSISQIIEDKRKKKKELRKNYKAVSYSFKKPVIALKQKYDSGDVVLLGGEDDTEYNDDEETQASLGTGQDDTPKNFYNKLFIDKYGYDLDTIRKGFKDYGVQMVYSLPSNREQFDVLKDLGKKEIKVKDGKVGALDLVRLKLSKKIVSPFNEEEIDHIVLPAYLVPDFIYKNLAAPIKNEKAKEKYVVSGSKLSEILLPLLNEPDKIPQEYGSYDLPGNIFPGISKNHVIYVDEVQIMKKDDFFPKETGSSQ